MNTFRQIIATLILIILCADNLLAQEVNAMYNEDKSELIIQNNSQETIYIFRKDIPTSIDGTKWFDKDVMTSEPKLFTFSCLDVKTNFVKVLPGQKEAFKIKRKCKETHVYYYPCRDNVVTNRLSIRIISQNAEEETAKSSESKKPESDNPVNTVPDNKELVLSQPKLSVPETKQPVLPDIKPEEILPAVDDNSSVTESVIKRAGENRAKQKNTDEEQARITQEELFTAIRDEYQRINSESRALLNKGKNMQPEDKELLDGKQRRLNSLKAETEKIVPIDSGHEKIKNNIIFRIISLIEHISEVTIADSKTIKEDYKEIYSKHSFRIVELQKLDSEIETIVNRKINESALTRWGGKDPIRSVINSLKEGIYGSEKDFESDKIQFIDKWQKEEKENLENLLIRQNDELKDGYNKLKYNAAMYENRINDLQPPYGTLILLTIVLLLLLVASIFYIRSYLRSKKLKEEESKMMENSIRSIDEDFEQPIYYESGLEELREDAEKGEYYIVDMNTIFDDTAIEKVYLSRNCILDIYKFFLEFLKLNGKTNETGCFVIGRWEEVSPDTYNLSLEEIIEPGSDAVYGEYELDFGTQIGIGLEGAIINMRQATHKDYVQTSWIHSHPGLGLFLSNHDLVVQSQLVYSDHPTRMLAIVIDSNTENLDTGFFTAKKTGEMNNKEDMKKILSFEKICQWAKGVQQPEVAEEIIQFIPEEITHFASEEITQFRPSDYYEYISVSPNAEINTFLFSGAAIIEMDYMTTLNTEGPVGYFYGKPLYEKQSMLSRKQVLIDNFRTEKTDEEEPIGCLLVLPQFTYQSVLIKYEPIIEHYDFFVVYNPRQDDLKIIARSRNGKYLIGAERDLHSLEMMELRKWTRRRRD